MFAFGSDQNSVLKPHPWANHLHLELLSLSSWQKLNIGKLWLMAGRRNPPRLIWLGRASGDLYNQRKVKYGSINHDKIGTGKVDSVLKGDKQRHKGLWEGVMFFILLHWSTPSLCFSKPIIWARGSKAFASSETSRSMTSFHRLRRGGGDSALNKRGFCLGLRCFWLEVKPQSYHLLAVWP